MQHPSVLKQHFIGQNPSLYLHFFLNLYQLPSSPPNIHKEPTLSTLILPLAPASSAKKSLFWRSVTYQSPNPMAFLQHLMVKQTSLSFQALWISLFSSASLDCSCLSPLTSDSPLFHIYRLHAPDLSNWLFRPPKLYHGAVGLKTQDNQGTWNWRKYTKT